MLTDCVRVFLALLKLRDNRFAKRPIVFPAFTANDLLEINLRWSLPVLVLGKPLNSCRDIVTATAGG